ncbi:MAG: flagellar assembly protein FliW [Lachnospiraceae bacterium]|nr:flagellar assembly protein FliW [Lachnospiraceae bacterium]
MRVTTRLFGEIDIEDSRILHMEHGMIGFPELQKFSLLYDSEREDAANISWLQSMDEPEIAFPVIDPLLICPDYDPTIQDELLEPLGELTETNLYVLVTVTVPKNIEEMAINLRAPIVINTDTMKGCQLIVEDDLPVKYKIYEQLKAAKEKAGE